jgi:hypothetical protein
VGPLVTVTVDSTTEHVLVQSNADVPLAYQLFFGVSYQSGTTQIPAGGYGGSPVAPASYIELPASGGQQEDVGASWVYTGLTPGTYQFGFVFDAYYFGAGLFNGETVITTAIVF